MTKFVLTFLVGVVTGGIGIQIQEARVERSEQQIAERVEQIAASHTGKSARTEHVTAARTEHSSANTRDATRMSASHSRPQEYPKSAPSVASETRNETAMPRAAPRNTQAREVPVTDAHQPLLTSTYDGRTLGELHETLEREAEDMSWSYEREQQLSEFFIPPHGLPFDVRSIECRTTMCEIQAFALGPIQQNTVLEDLQVQPWYDFASAFTEHGQHDGNTSVLMYLLRRR